MDTFEWFQFKLRQSVGEDVARPDAAAAEASAANSSAGERRGSEGGGDGDGGRSSEKAAAAAAAPACASAEIRRISGAPLGVEAIGYDLKSASDAQYDGLMAALHGEGRGVLVVRNQTLAPEHLETALRRLGGARGGFGLPLPYDRWPGQSPRLRCCEHLALLGNYRARFDDELGTGAKAGERIGEYKTAREELSEYHTAGSFLRRPKIAIALYAPSTTPIDTCTPCEPPKGMLPRMLRALVPCKPRCQPAPTSFLPPEGAQTAFASCSTAYEQMDDEEKARLEGLSSVHSWCDFMRFLEARDPQREKVSDAQCAAKPEQAWPIIRRHPVTGRKSVFVNPKNGLRVVSAADGATAVPPSVGDGLVLNLTDRVLATGVYKHTWLPGDLVVWDNRVLLHAATPFDPSKAERLIYRAEFPGEPVYFY